MENPPYVPYQAYKSKRHNRVQSHPQATSNGAPPPLQARPNPTVINGFAQSEPIVPHASNGVADAEKRSIATLNGRSTLQRPVSMIDTLTHLRQEFTSPPLSDANVEKVSIALPAERTIEKPAEKPLPPPLVVPSPTAVTPSLVRSPISSPKTSQPASPPPAPVPLSPQPSSPLPLSQTSSPKVLGKAVAQSSPAAGPSTLSPVASDRPVASPRKSSTFRHVPLRPPAASRPTLQSSPLSRPTSMIVQNTSSMLGSPRSSPWNLNQPTSAVSSAVSSPIMPAQDRALPPIPAFELQPRPSQSLSAAAAASSSPTPIAPIHAPVAVPKRSSVLMTSPAPDVAPPTHPVSSYTPPTMTPSTSTSSAVPSTARTPARSPAPYRPGFQPKGVYRPRTDEFINARNRSRDAGRIERTRLERRLEKLINLHFPPPGQSKSEAAEPRPKHENRRASSFWDLDLSELRSKSAGDLWREVVQSQASQNGKNDVRVAEQKITPWEDDASVSQCPICSASFHPLTNRKHHCRLCGRIVCSLPVKYPQRPQTCSLLFVVDQNTGRIEEVGEGVDYGVRRRSTAAPGKPQRRNNMLSDEEKFLKGVRVCRDCRPVLLRQQYRHEMGVVPLFTRLYNALISLEKEIEDELPVFQELVVNLARQERPTPEATAVRKRLLEAFGQYDALAKRIRQLPCAPGSSQDRIQGAIASRANHFLQKNMLPLQSLPKPNGKKAGSPSSHSPNPPEDQIIDPDSEVARVLQPLLEQEALLETFVEEAKAHRKFEDVKTLKSNLREIRAEIERILVNAEEQAPATRRTSART
ncbi:FYVE-domain-containing protein [Dichomitus squalens]|uniref:FYVE-domain-containing protein n=1 Tax=Dichomitus squalens TaxID=114155 RepID=A0A4Q9QE36_9APHY|nr:FYVE-domain-containing protein [Dichomitus squalens]